MNSAVDFGVELFLLFSTEPPPRPKRKTQNLINTRGNSSEKFSRKFFRKCCLTVILNAPWSIFLLQELHSKKVYRGIVFVSCAVFLRLVRLQNAVGMKEIFLELRRKFLRKMLRNFSLNV